MLERLSLQQLHGNDALAVRFVKIINRVDDWMIECRAKKSPAMMGVRIIEQIM